LPGRFFEGGDRRGFTDRQSHRSKGDLLRFAKFKSAHLPNESQAMPLVETLYVVDARGPPRRGKA
jgi:hypothetical protein